MGIVAFDHEQSHAAGCVWVEAPEEGNESAAPSARSIRSETAASVETWSTISGQRSTRTSQTCTRDCVVDALSCGMALSMMAFFVMDNVLSGIMVVNW